MAAPPTVARKLNTFLQGPKIPLAPAGKKAPRPVVATPGHTASAPAPKPVAQAPPAPPTAASLAEVDADTTGASTAKENPIRVTSQLRKPAAPTASFRVETIHERSPHRFNKDQYLQLSRSDQIDQASIFGLTIMDKAGVKYYVRAVAYDEEKDDNIECWRPLTSAKEKALVTKIDLGACVGFDEQRLKETIRTYNNRLPMVGPYAGELEGIGFVSDNNLFFFGFSREEIMHMLSQPQASELLMGERTAYVPLQIRKANESHSNGAVENPNHYIEDPDDQAPASVVDAVLAAAESQEAVAAATTPHPKAPGGKRRKQTFFS